MRTGQVCINFVRNHQASLQCPWVECGSTRSVSFVASHPCQFLELFTLTFLKMCVSSPYVSSPPTSRLFLEPLTNGRVAVSMFPSPWPWSHGWEADRSCTWGGKEDRRPHTQGHHTLKYKVPGFN